MSIERKIRAGFILALAFLIILGAVTWWSAERNAETVRMVDHTREVLGALEATLEDMLKAETGTRGFVVTGDD